MNIEHLTEFSVARSRVEMTQIVLPQFANAIGTAFGGYVMSWIDICAAVSAQRHCKGPAVTVSFDSINFIEPIKQGYIVIIKGQVNATFGSSMEIGAQVIAENPITGERKKSARAYCTFVAIDENGRPKKVPKLILETPDDQRRYNDAVKRREIRLMHRKEDVEKR